MSQRCHAQRAAGQYEVRHQRDQLRRVSAISIDIVLAPAGVDPDVAAVAPSQLLQGLLERRQLDLAAWIVRGPVHEHTEPPHRFGRLRARHNRPRRCTAKRSYELSAPYVDCHVILLVGVACSGEDLTTLQLDFMKNLLPAFSLDFTASR